MKSPKSPKQSKVTRLHQRATRDPPKQRHSISETPKRPPLDRDVNMLDVKRRSSSFASPSSPWARRRSFLSASMISSEKHFVYELHSGYSSNSPSYCISLRESQGFTWNQDLFASLYTQQSGLLYGDEDEDDDGGVAGREETEADRFQDVFYDDEDEEDFRNRRNRNFSMSNDHNIDKVKVIEIKIDEDESTL